jgi:hypothetical protein
MLDESWMRWCASLICDRLIHPETALMTPTPSRTMTSAM